MPAEKAILKSLKGNPNPITELNTFADERVLLYGHLGLCKTPDELLSSDGFQLILEHFIRKMVAQQSPVLECAKEFQLEGPNAKNKSGYDTRKLSEFLKLLLNKDINDIPYSNGSKPSKAREAVAWKDFIEELYGYWRKRERFIIFDRDEEGHVIDIEDYHSVFIRANEEFKILVLGTYRHICAHIMGDWFSVYRQVPAGGHVGMLAEKIQWAAPQGNYQKLLPIPFIRLSLIYPPLIYYTKSNKRKGKFNPLAKNPMDLVQFNPNQWLCYPAKVGTLIIFIYFHKDFISHASGLSNLFDLAKLEEITGRKPDGLMIFGVDPALMDNANVGYYEDKDNGLIVGAVAHKEECDYFGYFKKTALTIHNLIMIERDRLPIHGAMAKIDLKSGKSAHVVIVGDSGAGKSESLEAFRILADKYIRKLTIIFDDMGSLGIEADGKVTAHGTEIGAFVRLDDLRNDYAYNEIDRSVFMNPHLGNARLVVPVTEFRHVVAGYPVDILLYANNYDNVDEEHPHLEPMTGKEQILDVFSNGARLAKGTTDEKGLVHTYFANPFGAPQKKKKHGVIADKFVARLLETGKTVGQLRTQLGIPGNESSGPQAAAQALFQFITKNF